MTDIYSLLSKLSFSTLLIILLAVQPAADPECYSGPNPYGLSLECKLEQGLSKDITEFWSSFPSVEYFSGVDELNIAYRRFVNPAATKAIVISSGRSETFDKYQELIFDFYRQGYSIYIYDHRGQGYSDRVLPGRALYTRGHVKKFFHYVEDFEIFLERIVLPSKHKTYLLFSHSMGGSVAMHYLAENHNVFGAAAFSAPMARANTRVPLACKMSTAMSFFCDKCATPKPRSKSVAEAVKSGGLSHSMARYKISRQVYANPKLRLGAASYGWVREACKSARLIEKTALRIRTPSLVLQSGKDTLVLPEAQRRFCRSLADSLQTDCGPHVYPESKHEFYLEQDQYRVPALTQVLDFFNGHSGTVQYDR